MKRAATAVVLFVFAAAWTLFFCAWAGGQTPVLRAGEPLPAGASQQLYSLDPTLFVHTRGDLCISIPLEEDVSAPLSLTLCDCAPFTLFVNGVQTAQYSADGPYSRVIIISLGSDFSPAGQTARQLELRFAGEAWQNAGQKELSNIPKMLLGSSEATQRALTFSFGLTMLLIGAFFVLIVSSFTLFLQKRTERYLLLLAGASCVVMVTTVFTSSVPLLPIRYTVYLSIRPYIASFPLLVNGAVCLSLMKNALPSTLQRFARPVWLLPPVALLLCVQLLTGKNTYHLLTALMLLPVLTSLICGARKKEPGVWLLAIGYGVWQGIALRVYAVNELQAQLAGAPDVYFRITQLGHLVYLLCCMALINQRYARKFGESEQLNELLDTKVAQRTQELVQEQEQRRTMMLNIFHDLRSPLFALRGHLEELETGGQDRRKLFGDIHLRMDFLQRLIEHLFLLSKLEGGKLRFDGDYVELSRLLQQQAPGLRAQAQRADLCLTLSAAGPLWVWGDEVRLQQIVQNLVDNAISNTPAGGNVFLSLCAEKGQAVLRVADTGRGIPQQELARVFDRYYHKNRTGDQNSTGLGLAIVKSLAELHHGTVTVCSEAGCGACFTFRLPLLEKA